MKISIPALFAAAALAHTVVHGGELDVDETVDEGGSMEEMVRAYYGFVEAFGVRDWFDEAAPLFEAAGITLTEQTRDWDRAFWPHAKAGFFGVKKKIESAMREAGIAGA